MNKILLATCFLLLASVSFAQKDTLPLYQQFKTIPPFKLLKADSSGWITKDDLKKHHAVIIMLFAPDCEHCQKQTEILLENIDSLNDVEIVMATQYPLDEIKTFAEKNKLYDHPNFHIGRDKASFLGTFFNLSTVPLLAVYNKKGEIKDVFDGGAQWNKLSEALK